jgi:hypothetical protein
LSESFFTTSALIMCMFLATWVVAMDDE